jgi:hypothetical protein
MLDCRWRAIPRAELRPPPGDRLGRRLGHGEEHGTPSRPPTPPTTVAAGGTSPAGSHSGSPPTTITGPGCRAPRRERPGLHELAGTSFPASCAAPGAAMIPSARRGRSEVRRCMGALRGEERKGGRGLPIRGAARPAPFRPTLPPRPKNRAGSALFSWRTAVRLAGPSTGGTGDGHAVRRRIPSRHRIHPGGTVRRTSPAIGVRVRIRGAARARLGVGFARTAEWG